MASNDSSNWVFDYSLIDDDVPVSAADFTAATATAPSEFYWTPQGISHASNGSVKNNGSFVDAGGFKESSSRKRVRSESGTGPGPKACREKMRRDKLNDRFLELGSILEPGKPPKMDKEAILSDAARAVTQLRSEAHKLKDSNENLQEKIRELKAEKNELRDEKQKLKSEKENLEQQIKIFNSQFNSQPSFMPHPPVIPAAFAAPGQAAGHKLMMPVIGYPGYPMWQFMPPAAVDTSQDVESCPPVA